MTNLPAKELIASSHPMDDLLRADRFPHILCPGCGIGTVIHSYVQAIHAFGAPENDHVCVSGIGCSGRAAGYVNVDSYHVTHGRALPFAIGIAAHKPHLQVTVISGDGDLAAIGGNHLIHAARRNINLNVICINNFNYGMTGGQAGPTTPRDALASTAPLGVHDRPFNLPQLTAAAGASFVARWTVLHVHQLKESLLRTFQKNGFSFVEIISPCPTNFGRSNDLGPGLNELTAYKERCVINNGAPLSEIEIDVTNDQSPIVVGNFVDIKRQPFIVDANENTPGSES